MTSPANQNRPPLLLSRLDAERIEALIEQPQYRSLNTSALQDELARAEIAEPAQMPADIITMNSTARVRLEEAGQALFAAAAASTQPGAAGGDGGPAPAAGDDVVDAEFTEVKDDDKAR